MRVTSMICTIEDYLSLANSDSTEDNKRTIHEELSPTVISSIINKYPKRKSWLVHNKHVPIDVLRSLSNDSDEDVRFTIAMKKKCDREIFKILMRDRCPSVRMAVVRNNKLPLDLLEEMRSDGDPEISSKAARILEERMKKK